MATSHHLHTTPLRRRRLRTPLIAATLLAAAFVGMPAATAAPADDRRVDAARSQHDAVAAEIAALSGRVTEAEQKLQRMTLEAEAASGNALAAQAALDAANQEAEAAEVALFEAKQAVGEAQDEVSEMGRQAYMGGGQDAFGDLHLLLDAEGPAELLQQAATLDTLGVQRAEVLDAMEIVEVQQTRAEEAAKATVAERDRAAGAAAEAHAAAAQQLSGAQAEFDALALQKLGLAQQLGTPRSGCCRCRAPATPPGRGRPSRPPARRPPRPPAPSRPPRPLRPLRARGAERRRRRRRRPPRR